MILKNSLQIKIKVNFLNLINRIYWKPAAITLSTEKLEHLLEDRNMIRIPTINTSIQHCTTHPSQRSREIRKDKWHTVWRGRNKKWLFAEISKHLKLQKTLQINSQCKQYSLAKLYKRSIRKINCILMY